MDDRNQILDKSSFENHMMPQNISNQQGMVGPYQQFAKQEKFRAVKDYYRKNPFTVIITFVALILSILFLTIGFFRTLLIIILVGIGFIYGQFKDRKPWAYMLIRQLFR